MAEADFGQAIFVLTQKGNEALRTDSVLNQNRVYRWLKKTTKPNGTTYYCCSHCRSIKESEQRNDSVSVYFYLLS